MRCHFFSQQLFEENQNWIFTQHWLANDKFNNDSINLLLVCLFFSSPRFLIGCVCRCVANLQIHGDVWNTTKDAWASTWNALRWTSGTKRSIPRRFLTNAHRFYARADSHQRISQFISFFPGKKKANQSQNVMMCSFAILDFLSLFLSFIANNR